MARNLIGLMAFEWLLLAAACCAADTVATVDTFLTNCVKIWDVPTETQLRVLPRTNWTAHRCVFTPDGGLVTTGPDRSVTLWNTATAEPIRSFTGVVAGNGTLSVSVMRRDLRPLQGVSVRMSGAMERQEVTDGNGQAAFEEVFRAGEVTIRPVRSGFRFEPESLSIPDLANPPLLSFFAFPTTTDLQVTLVTDDETPRVGGLIHEVVTLRNLGVEAATDVSVAMTSLPGLVLEDRQATQGRLDTRGYATVWTLSQLDPGASAQVQVVARATLPGASVLAVAMIEEMDQTDVNPVDNSVLLTVRPLPAEARPSLTMTIDPATAKAGETIPVRLTVRNDGPNDATQVAIRCYLPPGASFQPSTELSGLTSRVLIPRLAAGGQVELGALMRVRIPGTFTLIANVTYMEQALSTGAAWPEARADFTVQPAYARIALLAFTDPQNPRVGDDVNVTYVARNDGPDAVTGLHLYTSEDPRLGVSLSGNPNHPVPPVPGPFVFGDYLPAGSYTYLAYRYSIKAAGDLTNYFTVQYQDQLIPDAADHAELFVPIKALPADVGLSLDANPKELIVEPGAPVTLEFPVHNDGPQPARGIFVDFDSRGLTATELDEVIYPGRVVRTATAGYVEVLEPGETVRVRKHFVGSLAGVYTNWVQIRSSFERPDLLQPIAAEPVRLQVLPGPPVDLAISVSVDKPLVNVGEYAIFIVTVENRAAQPAVGVSVRETDAVDADFALETVRSYGPGGDNRYGSAASRWIPRIEPGASYSMSRTMRVRKPVTIPYVAKIAGANGLLESDLPAWVASTEVSGIRVESDIAVTVVPDRTTVKNGDLVNFAILTRNLSAEIASHPIIVGGAAAGFQVLGSELGSYGYYFDTARPKTPEIEAKPLTEWSEIHSQEIGFSFLSTYTVAAGRFWVGAELSQMDQPDAQAANNYAPAEIESASSSSKVTLRQSVFPQHPSVGDLVLFVTEIRNEGPDRVTGLSIVEESSANLELTLNPGANGVSGDVATSIFDSLVRLPALEPGQDFIWQRSFVAHAAGSAWHRVRVAGFDQTVVAPPQDNDAVLTIEPAQADLELRFTDAPTVLQEGIQTRFGVRVRNLGPGVATGVKVAIDMPPDALRLGVLGYGPRASYDFLESNVFRTALLPGESARVDVYITPTRTGSATGFASVRQSDQIDPNPANDSLSLTVDIDPAPPIPAILRVRKVRMDFFDQTPIAEVEVDQAALDRYAPFTTFWLDGTSNLREWERLALVGLFPLAPVTFTDRAVPGVNVRAYRLSR